MEESANVNLQLDLIPGGDQASGAAKTKLPAAAADKMNCATPSG
jgi:hypothetical protein